ncbi:hypothetical protein [Candidatus Electronema sp. TJ]|uniref:hypothetical protein n=1 Tax=Candidatus Electronema sp. TJ TaxID=3401573 RepID=UPI003AA8C22C
MLGSPSKKNEHPHSGADGGGGSPSAEQLWSTIEFSRNFPELTLYLAADVKARRLAERKRLQLSDHDEPLEFPPLVAPDPRELRPAHPLPEKQAQAPPLNETLELFASGQLPPSESAAPPPDSSGEHGKKSFWRNILAFSFFSFC